MTLRRTLLAALALALGAFASGLPASAGADPAPAPPALPVDLPMRDGKTLHGTVESADPKEVVLRVGPQDVRHLPWDSLTPQAVFRARAALAAPDAGPARLALAELASELGLWAEARAEYEKALALKALDARSYERAVFAAERRAIETGVARADRAADAGDMATALEILRGLKLDFAGAADAGKVDDRIADLETRIRQREADQRRAQAELEKAVLEADRRREILARLTEAKKQAALGDRLASDARAQMPNGVVSRVRRLADAADQAYVAARRELGRLRRILRPDEPEREQVLALLGTLDQGQYRLLFDAAKFFWDQRVYAAADEYAARASYVDPVDPALLELRTEVREHRIRYRMSDVTNAIPR